MVTYQCTCPAMVPQKPADGWTGESANCTTHNPNNTAASHHASSMLIRNNVPTNDCPSVMSNSSSCWESKAMVDGAPRLSEKTMGSIAASSVHWLILLETI